MNANGLGNGKPLWELATVCATARRSGDPHRAFTVTPGFLRSKAMLEGFEVTEENWRDAAGKQAHFILSESPAYLGRGVAALAADPGVARFAGHTLSSGQLANEYGLTDVDGSRPDIWRYFADHGTEGPVDPSGYR